MSQLLHGNVDDDNERSRQKMITDRNRKSLKSILRQTRKSTSETNIHVYACPGHPENVNLEAPHTQEHPTK
jgi:peroxiredoxin family protein